jgi:hypothetical protein
MPPHLGELFVLNDNLPFTLETIKSSHAGERNNIKISRALYQVSHNSHTSKTVVKFCGTDFDIDTVEIQNTSITTGVILSSFTAATTVLLHPAFCPQPASVSVILTVKRC